MGLAADGRTIVWRVHLRAAPAEVYDMLASPAGRRRFWAVSAEEVNGSIAFHFLGGQTLEGRILERTPPSRYALSYFGGSRVVFALSSDGQGGTDLELTETGAPDAEVLDDLAGWVSVLLGLKAAVDFGVDLRNHDSRRQWGEGYVDV
jgi:uncharacterized protein YndB with AHSA1/START domain